MDVLGLEASKWRMGGCFVRMIVDDRCMANYKLGLCWRLRRLFLRRLSIIKRPIVTSGGAELLVCI